jgi:hypothetical protein
LGALCHKGDITFLYVGSFVNHKKTFSDIGHFLAENKVISPDKGAEYIKYILL